MLPSSISYQLMRLLFMRQGEVEMEKGEGKSDKGNKITTLSPSLVQAPRYFRPKAWKRCLQIC